jgi:phosphoenolpyruvate carboxylase
MSARLVAVTDELAALAENCDELPRADEPYRRALRVIRARLSATAVQILDDEPANLLDLGLPRYAAPGELLADLDTVGASLRANGSTLLADDRLARLREAVHVFGFHLSGLDMRQNSDVHEEVVAELLAWAGVHPDYGALSEDERVNILADELNTRRPLVGDREQLSELARKELGIVSAAKRAVDIYGRAHLHHLDVSFRLRPAGSRDPAEGMRSARRLRRRAVLPGGHRPAVRDDRRPASRCVDSRSGT